MMSEAKQPEPIKSEPKESIASRIERREAEIALAMKEEAERREAVVKNMHRLRALRLSQTPKASASRALSQIQSRLKAVTREAEEDWGR
jgi:hypothetical protein